MCVSALKFFTEIRKYLMQKVAVRKQLFDTFSELRLHQTELFLQDDWCKSPFASKFS